MTAASISLFSSDCLPPSATKRAKIAVKEERLELLTDGLFKHVLSFLGARDTAGALRVSRRFVFASHLFLKARTYVTTLVERGLFTFKAAPYFARYQGESFPLLVREGLMEMGMEPKEMALLKAIASEAEERGAQIGFEQSYPDVSPAFAKLHNVKLKSCACYETGSKGKIHWVALDPDTPNTSLKLMGDSRGAWHLEPTSFRRTLAHELLHVYCAITGRHVGYERLPKTVRWTNAHEEMAITGACAGESIEFSENAFALARGEMHRVSHLGVATVSKEELFVKAFIFGADGTVSRLLAEAARREELEKCFASRQAIDKFAFRSLQLTSLFFLDGVSDERLIKACAHNPFVEKSLPAQTDLVFFQEMTKRRSAAFQLFINTLKSLGRKERAERIVWNVRLASFSL
ncbi:MAG: hypothetical protein HYX48_06045 [Chlamydiales bacterium]|nr:hypothetical protein [Chlamydiales bacterium]